MDRARDLSWERHGRKVVFYVPGQTSYDELRGRHPVISITGRACAQRCDHCNGKLLDDMLQAPNPDFLASLCARLAKEGAAGVLLSGGSDGEGRLPWTKFAPTVARVARETNLRITAHTGLVDRETARLLKRSGVSQALIDVVGSDETARDVLHLENGVERIGSTLDALSGAGLDVVPHIVVGLHRGRLLGEERAVAMIARHPVRSVVVVGLDPRKGTPMEGVEPPGPLDIARVAAMCRLAMPDALVSLGCARPRLARLEADVLCVQSGINRVAGPSREAVEAAGVLGLETEFAPHCCSMDPVRA